MSLPDNLGELLNAPVEESHEFEVDLSCLVMTNHKFTIEGIARAEDAEITALDESLREETDYDAVSCIRAWHQNFYDDLRVAARNLALVSLVTRLQHWAGAYARRIDPARKGHSLSKEFDFLNDRLGNSPIDVGSFSELEEVRNSVIHADSQPQWTFQGRKISVDPRYTPNGYRVEVSDGDLKQAIESAITQIKWYDEKLRAIHK